MYHLFNINKPWNLLTGCIYISSGSHSKYLLLPWTSSIDWYLQLTRILLCGVRIELSLCTDCISGNLPYFGWCLKVTDIDITKDNYIRKWTVTEIKDFLWFTAQVRPWADSQAKPYAGQFMLCKVLGTLQTICMKPVRVSLAQYLSASQMSIRC
jgi:hypothetical protein